MRCTTCGHELSYLTAVLAQTRIGTQCPDCWTILRCVHGNRAFATGEFHGMSGEARKASGETRRYYR